MIRILDMDTALKTILKRQPIQSMDYPASVLARTENLFGPGVTPPIAVSQILESVRKDGDSALRHWTAKIDRVELDHLPIDPGDFEKAWDALDDGLRQVLEVSAARIRQFHQMQPLPNWQTGLLGGRTGQRVRPVSRAGVYVPGGTAPLPSSLLMSVIPAQVAGVSHIIVCTPPNPSPVILAAAHICGLSEVYPVGGAQAIAAFAFGTESIPRVDKIVGAGNLFVTLAKQQVYGIVGLDGLAGPTETMIIADDSANPAWVAADLLAQAEHDPMASAILLTPDPEFAVKVQAQVAAQLEELSRGDIILTALDQRGGIVIISDLDTGADLASDFAPEHLCIVTRANDVIAERVQNAGGLFIGEHSFEVLGDYVAGPSHVMPTGGTARFASPLNVLDFVKISSIVALDQESSQVLSPLAATFARTEKLTAHAAAASFRSK